MTDDAERKINQKNKELVNRIYAGALNPSDYNELFKAWDDHFDAIVDQDERKKYADYEWTDELVSHFEQAGWLFDRMLYQSEKSVEERIDDFLYAVVLCSLDGKIVRYNKFADNLFEDKQAETVFDLSLEPSGLLAINALIKTAKEPIPQPHERLIIKVHEAAGGNAHLFLGEIVEEKRNNTNEVNSLILLRAVTASWDERVSRALSSAFQLTRAELELVAALYKGFTIKEISKWKRRSQATLRTQLSSVLQKTNTRSQADLSRIISGLVQVLVQEELPPELHSRAMTIQKQSMQQSKIVRLENDIEIEVVESGDLDGLPFYFIQTSTQPLLTTTIVELFKEAGIRLISPNRPGVGGTKRTPISTSPAEWAKYHLEVINKLDVSPNYIGGHCSGGVYSLELAKLIGADCKGVLQVDVGAPLRNASMINEMPAAPRRLFLAARFFPPAIRMPYKLVTRDFFESREGEDRLVNYFYEGSPFDEAILHEGDNWLITRNNLDYCLQNPTQISQDVTYWSRDNSSVLEAVVKNTHVRFFHGEANYVHQAVNIRKLSNKLPNISYNIVPDRGQLLIYVEPELFVQEIRGLCRSNDTKSPVTEPKAFADVEQKTCY